MLRMANAEPRLMNGLQEAVLLLCKAGLKFESTLSVNGLLAITVDQKDVFLVNFKQTIEDSEDHTIRLNYGDEQPTEDTDKGAAGNSISDLEPKRSSNDFVAISDNCVQGIRQKCVNVENCQGDTFNESRSVADLDDCSGDDVLAIESNRRPISFRRHAMNLLKRPLNLVLQRRCKEQQINFSPGSSSNLEYLAEEVEHAQRDELVNVSESRFDFQAHGMNTGMSNIECAVATTETDQHLLCKIKQEPRDESQFAYQVSHHLGALSQSEIPHDEPKDYSQFSAHSYIAQHLLQSQATTWSSEAQSMLARTASLHHNMSTANWPRRQIRSSDKSICVNCGTNTTTVWRRGKEGQLLCNACGCYYKLHKTHRPKSLMKDNIRRRSRRHQGLRWTMDALPESSPHNVLPFPLGWTQQDVEQS